MENTELHLQITRKDVIKRLQGLVLPFSDVLSKLESQICRNDNLPKVYRKICSEGFKARDELRNVISDLQDIKSNSEQPASWNDIEYIGPPRKEPLIIEDEIKKLKESMNKKSHEIPLDCLEKNDLVEIVENLYTTLEHIKDRLNLDDFVRRDDGLSVLVQEKVSPDTIRIRTISSDIGANPLNEDWTQIDFTEYQTRRDLFVDVTETVCLHIDPAVYQIEYKGKPVMKKRNEDNFGFVHNKNFNDMVNELLPITEKPSLDKSDENKPRSLVAVSQEEYDQYMNRITNVFDISKRCNELLECNADGITSVFLDEKLVAYRIDIPEEADIYNHFILK